MGKTAVKPPSSPVEGQARDEWVPDATLQRVPSNEYRVFRRRNAVKIELTRPENRNALTAPMVGELRNLYGRIAEDPSIFRIYLTGQGRVFCAGMNLSASGSATKGDEEEQLAQLEKFRSLLHAIEQAPQVTIALINGPCYGGGNGLAFANDIRLCTRDATFNLTEVRLGISPCAISPFLAREWGIPLLRTAMLTGAPVAPAKLHAIGAVYAIADDNAQLQGKAFESLEGILEACAPHASTVCKELAHAAWMNPGGPFQNELIRSRYLEMMAPSEEAKYGIEQFRKGVKKVDWAAMKKSLEKRESHL